MAIAAAVDWIVRTDGDDTFGGGYNQGAGTTDYSNQSSAQLSLTDCATSGTTVTTLTSATGGFTAAMVGNCINLSSGTNLTVGIYEITGYTDTNTVTLDRAPDDGVGGVSGATGKVGGAFATIQKAVNVVETTNQGNHGQTIYVKAGTYNEKVTLSSDWGGTVSDGTQWMSLVGFSTTPGEDLTNSEANWPIIDAQSGTRTHCVQSDGTSAQWYLAFFRFTGASTHNVDLASDSFHLYSCVSDNSTGSGFYSVQNAAFEACRSHTNGGSGWAQGTSPVGGPRCYGCIAHDNTSLGIGSGGGGGTVSAVHCLTFDNGDDGLGTTDVTQTTFECVCNVTSFGNTASGLSGSRADGAVSLFVNNILSGNGRYGMECSTNATHVGPFQAGCVIRDSSTGTAGTRNTLGERSGNVPDQFSFALGGLSSEQAEPEFTSVTDGSEDFTPGTNMKAAGVSFPTNFGTSYIDVGGVQRQEGAGGGLIINPGMTGGVGG